MIRTTLYTAKGGQGCSTVAAADRSPYEPAGPQVAAL